MTPGASRPDSPHQLLQQPPGQRTVGDAMVTVAKLSPADASVGEVRAVFRDRHVHAALMVDGDALVSVVDRDDLDPGVPDHEPAARHGTLSGRVIAPDMPLGQAWRRMTDAGRRRLAVIDDRGAFHGLLCLKNSGRGFCSNADVLARSEDEQPG